MAKKDLFKRAQDEAEEAKEDAEDLVEEFKDMIGVNGKLNQSTNLEVKME